jgi:hypothetical protein
LSSRGGGLGEDRVVTDPIAALAMLDGVFETVEAARAGVDSLRRELRSPALRSRTAEVTRECVRRSAWASATLEGAVGPVEDFRAPLADPPARNVLDLYAGLAALASTFASAPGQALARMHAMAAADRVPDDQLGRPSSGAAADRLEALIRLLGTPTTAPAIVVAGVVHGEVASVRAFGVGSGVVARLASRCVLVSRGLDPSAVTVPEEGHLVLGRSVYAEALDAYATGTSEGVGQWLAHCAEAVAVGAGVGVRVARAVSA